MALTKKGSRPITVDETTYRWTIRRKPSYSQGIADSLLTVGVEHGERSGSVLVVKLPQPHSSNWLGQPAVPVRPVTVALAIRAAIEQGWKPDQPGSPFRISFGPGLSPSLEDAVCGWRLTWQVSDLGLSGDCTAVPRESPSSPARTSTQRARGLCVVRLCHPREMLTVENLRTLLRAAWGPDTCYPHASEDWTPDNPARDQCGMTALVVQDLLGGDLILGEVHVDGTKVGHHYWNRLPDSTEIDLTAEQFLPEEIVVNGRVVTRPPDAPRRHREQYELLRDRVLRGLNDSGSSPEGQ